MSQDERYIDPKATQLVFNNLIKFNDENKLLHQIEHVAEEISRLSEEQVDADDMTGLNTLMSALEVQVNYLRDINAFSHKQSTF